MFRLREIRKARGLTMQQLGRMVGCTESAIGLYENCKRKPSYEMLLKLSDALDCSIEEILGTSYAERAYAARNPETTRGDRILFHALRDATEEDKIRAARILEALKNADIESMD